MLNPYLKSTENFESIIDFLRFGMSEANKSGLYFGHGTDNVYDDLLWLISASLSLPYHIEPNLLHARLTDTERTMLAEQLYRRIISRIPVPYLIKEARFCDLSFYVDERVLIPRSPIAELIKEQFSPWIEEENVERILDLCTGSGCIAIACAYAFPEAVIDAVDISSQALEVAEVNQRRHQLQDQLHLIQSDCWEQLPHRCYDIIVSNPPYVGDEEMATLPPEFRHEPELALRSQENGLAIVSKILQQAHYYLAEHGILVVEVGNSEEALVEAYPDLDFLWLEFEHGGQGVFLLTYDQLHHYFGK